MADIDQEIKNLYLLAKKMRYSALEMSLNCGEATHLGGGLSIIEIMAIVYGKLLDERSDQKLMLKTALYLARVMEY